MRGRFWATAGTSRFALKRSLGRGKSAASRSRTCDGWRTSAESDIGAVLAIMCAGIRALIHGSGPAPSNASNLRRFQFDRFGRPLPWPRIAFGTYNAMQSQPDPLRIRRPECTT